MTESWNGSCWTEVSDLSTARLQLGQAGAIATSALAFGGILPPGGNTTATEEWTFPPATASTLQEGDMWFNSSSSVLKGYGKAAGIPAGTWASGGSLNTARRLASGAGTQTASILISGYSCIL